MFMKIGNEEKSQCVPVIKILDVNAGLNVVDFISVGATGSVILKTASGIKITCKSQDYTEFLEIIETTRKAVLNDLN